MWTCLDTGHKGLMPGVKRDKGHKALCPLSAHAWSAGCVARCSHGVSPALSCFVSEYILTTVAPCSVVPGARSIDATRVARERLVIVVERSSGGRCVVPFRKSVCSIELWSCWVTIEPELHACPRATVVTCNNAEHYQHHTATSTQLCMHLTHTGRTV